MANRRSEREREQEQEQKQKRYKFRCVFFAIINRHSRFYLNFERTDAMYIHSGVFNARNIYLAVLFLSSLSGRSFSHSRNLHKIAG